MPLGRVILGQRKPPPWRWGSGGSGTVEWSNDLFTSYAEWHETAGGTQVNRLCARTHKHGTFEVDKLTIKEGTFVEIPQDNNDTNTVDHLDTGMRRLVIFATSEIVIEDNVFINAGYNDYHVREGVLPSDRFHATRKALGTRNGVVFDGNCYKKGATTWSAPHGNYANLSQNEIISYTGGGGGGANAIQDGSTADGNDAEGPVFYRPQRKGVFGIERHTSYSGEILAFGAAGGPGAEKTDGVSHYHQGSDGYPKNQSEYDTLANKIKDNFEFTTRGWDTTLDTSLPGFNNINYVDYPVFIGGRGANGRDYSLAAFDPQGGRGGGTIILIAPKITIGNNCAFHFEGNRANYGSGELMGRLLNDRFSANQEQGFSGYFKGDGFGNGRYNHTVFNNANSASHDYLTFNNNMSGGDYPNVTAGTRSEKTYMIGAGGGGGGGFCGIVTTPGGYSEGSNLKIIGNGRSAGGYGYHGISGARWVLRDIARSRGSGPGGAGGAGIFLKGTKAFSDDDETITWESSTIGSVKHGYDDDCLH